MCSVVPFSLPLSLLLACFADGVSCTIHMIPLNGRTGGGYYLVREAFEYILTNTWRIDAIHKRVANIRVMLDTGKATIQRCRDSLTKRNTHAGFCSNLEREYCNRNYVTSRRGLSNSSETMEHIVASPLALATQSPMVTSPMPLHLSRSVSMSSIASISSLASYSSLASDTGSANGSPQQDDQLCTQAPSSPSSTNASQSKWNSQHLDVPFEQRANRSGLPIWQAWDIHKYCTVYNIDPNSTKTIRCQGLQWWVTPMKKSNLSKCDVKCSIKALHDSRTMATVPFMYNPDWPAFMLDPTPVPMCPFCYRFYSTERIIKRY